MSGEKTELPTPKKERDARAKGQVAKSTEVVTAASLIAVIFTAWVGFEALVAEMTVLMDEVARLATVPFAEAWRAGLAATTRVVLVSLLPVLGVAVAVAIAANYLQIGSLFSLESISPKLDKISPASGFKRIFSTKQLVEMLKSIIKIAFLSVLLYIVLTEEMGNFIRLPQCGLNCIVGLVDHTLFRILAFSSGAFIVVAVADLFWQRHTHTKSLMMSKDEVKREYKESEGDPHIKGMRKQLGHEMAMGGQVAAARKGTAAIVNPTHLIVVLSYRPESYPLPIVTAKGRERTAAMLRAEAEAAGVPVFRNVALARALFEGTEIDQAVPDDLFDAVAEVLAWVNRNRGKLYAGVLDHGVIDMEADDHRPKDGERTATGAGTIGRHQVSWSPTDWR